MVPMIEGFRLGVGALDGGNGCYGVGRGHCGETMVGGLRGDGGGSCSRCRDWVNVLDSGEGVNWNDVV